MTEQHLTPDPDDAEGHILERADEAGDDTEGHILERADEAGDDTEGHIWQH